DRVTNVWPQPTEVTDDDVAALNTTAMERSAVVARIAGTALVVAGVIGLLAWLWLFVRAQQVADDRVGFGSSADLADRIDLGVQTISLGIIAALVTVTGFAVRTVADYFVVRTGGSLTGFEAGDQVPEPEDIPGGEDIAPPPPPPPGAP